MSRTAELLRQRREAVAQELADLDQNRPGGLPDVGGPGEVAHVAYRQSLLAEIDQLTASIIEVERTEEGSQQYVSRGYTPGV